MNASRYGLGFHHYGLAVREEGPARKFLEGLGYTVGELITDPLQQVRVSLARAAGMPTVELVLPTDQPGPITSLLKSRDAIVYHSCYTTRDAGATLAAIAGDGLDLMTVSEAKPAILFHGLNVSFHYVAGFGLIELIHIDASRTIAL